MLAVVPAALGAPLLARAQGAAEVCVECTGPASSYRCTVEQGEKVTKFRAGDKALQFLCVTELARQGQHEKCRVRREGAGACSGEIRSIALPNVDLRIGERAQPGSTPAQTPGAAGAAASPAHPPVIGAAPQPAEPSEGSKQAGAPHPPAQEGPPRTVAEMAKRAGENSGESLKKAGGAVKKGWNCVISLFSDC